MEAKEMAFLPLSDDDSLPKHSPIITWHDKLHGGATICGANLRMTSSDLKALFERAGFINVTVLDFKLPIGTWPKGRKWKQIGLFQQEVLREDLGAFSLTIFQRFLNWSMEEVEMFLNEVRMELLNLAYHWYWPL